MSSNWKIPDRGVKAIMVRSVIQIVRRPLMWIGMLGLPLFLFLFLGSLLEPGLPTKVPAAIVDKDGTQLSRSITQSLDGMQAVNLTRQLNSFTEGRHAVQRGDIYGFFFIPENFQADLLAGRGPEITFYTNMTYYVPGSLLLKTFKSTAVYAKAGVAAEVVQTAGADPKSLAAVMQPITIQARGIGNPTLNYGIYLGNSFIPCVLQLMILLITVWSLGQETKYHTSAHLMEMAGGSSSKALFAKLFPQTVIWWVVAIFMLAWLYRFQHYPMNGSWFWMVISEMLFVVATQAFAVFIFGLLPNLRFSLSVCALTGILSFSIAAFSFPEQSMYPAMGIFSWLMPIRYNFLIYGDIALAGRDVFYARWWYFAYLVYLALPLPLLLRMRREMVNPCYIP